MKLWPSLAIFRNRTKDPKQILSDQWSEREAILNNQVNLFCWRRPINVLIKDYLEDLIQKDLENIKVSISLTSIEQDLVQARNVWDSTMSNESNAFWHDVTQLSKDFLSMSGNGEGTLHLRKVNNDACTKFHLDGYHLRLFTTYYGPGTEWLPEKSVNRTALGKSNELIVKQPELIKRMQPLEVGILKGEIANRSNHTPGIVHRSPSIRNTEQQRVIMRIDI